MNIVDYILDQPEPAASIIGYFHDFFKSTYPQIELTMKYEIPFFVGNHWICYLNPIKKGGVELCFTRGNELSNEQGLLSSRGRKQVFGVVYHQLRDIDEEVLLEVLTEALVLDEEVKYASKRKKK